MERDQSLTPQPGKLEIFGPPDGRQFTRLDAQTSEYYMCRYNLAKAALVSETTKELPLVGYLIPTGFFNVEQVEKWQAFALQPIDEQLPTPSHFFGYSPAIRIAVVGKAEKSGYVKGATVQFSTGILFKPSIVAWLNWRYLSALWIPKVWESAGFDYRHFLGERALPRLPMETLAIEAEKWLTAKTEDDVSVLCDLLRISAKGAPALDRSIRERIQPLTEAEIRQVYRNAEEKQFSEIENVTACIPARIRLLLVINLLFNHWETREPKLQYGERARHIEQLGLPDQDKTSMWNYCAEAGCIPLPRSILLKQLEQLRKQANRFFNKHPEELEKLEDNVEPTSGHVFTLPPVVRKKIVRKEP